MKSTEPPRSGRPGLYKVSHSAFLLGLALKGLNAVFELVIGVTLLSLPVATMQKWALGIVHSAAPFFSAGVLSHAAKSVEHVSSSTVAFAAWYFLSHAVLKALVIAALMARKTWAYPLGIAVFAGFLGYQTWEYLRVGGIFYIYLDILDLALIVLTALEWRHKTKVS